MDYVTIDFETAVYGQYILSYGIVKVHNSEVVDELYSLVYPPDGRIDPFLSSIHGITIEMATGKGEFPEHWDKIKNFIGDMPIVAHNPASVARNYLVKTLDYYGLELPDNLWGCSKKMAEKLYQLKNYKLYNIAKHLDIDVVQHNSLDDAHIIAQIANDAYEKFGQEGFMKFFRTKESFMPKPKRWSDDYVHFDLESIPYNNQLEGISIAVTGALRSMSRVDVMVLIDSLGGRADQSVKKDTQKLIVGYDRIADFKDGIYTAKLKKAIIKAEEDPTFEIMEEEAFMRWIGAKEKD